MVLLSVCVLYSTIQYRICTCIMNLFTLIENTSEYFHAEKEVNEAQKVIDKIIIKKVVDNFMSFSRMMQRKIKAEIN